MAQPARPSINTAKFPVDRWWVAALSSELTDKPIARTLLGHPVVLFRLPSGEVGALEDRCCHKSLPLSCGSLEARGLRCGYHGLLFDRGGACVEIPGQDRIPAKACVSSYPVQEQDAIVWIWIGADAHANRPARRRATRSIRIRNTGSAAASTITTRRIN